MLSWLFDKAAKPIVRYGYNKVKERILKPVVYLRFIAQNDKGAKIMDIDVKFRVTSTYKGKRYVNLTSYLMQDEILHYPDNMNFMVYNSETGKLITKFRLPWRLKTTGNLKSKNVCVDC
jgi:hypothetical protein